MKIQCFHSSSKGNLYGVSDGTTQIMIDCGVEFQEIRKCFNFSISALAGCLITHEHGDHAKSWDKVARYTPVYMLKETAESLKATGYNVKVYTPKQAFKLGTFLVVAIPAVHDVPCCSFLIRSIITNEVVLFATDTAYITHKVYNVNYAMIECNYQLEILNKAVDSGHLDASARNRIVASHLGLDTALNILKGINPATLQEIHILHLSSRNSNPTEIKKIVERELGKPVYVAKE